MAVNTDKVAPAVTNGSRQRQREQSRYDQDLGTAKNNGTKVKFVLGIEVPQFTDEEGTIVGYVTQLDKYDIEVRPVDGPEAQRVWIKKSAILVTKVLR